MSSQSRITNVNEIFIASVANISYFDLKDYLLPKISRNAKVFPKGTVFYLLCGIHHGPDGEIGRCDPSLNSQFHYTLFNNLQHCCGYLECEECQGFLTEPCSSNQSVWDEMEYEDKIVPLYTVAQDDNDDSDEEEEKYELSPRSKKDLMKLSKELTEQTRPSALIFASCNSLYSSITDILRANGIIATMNISKDLGEVTEGKVFHLDDQQKTVMSDIRDVSFFKS